MFSSYSEDGTRSQSSRDDETEIQDDEFVDALSRAGPRSNGTGTSGDDESDRDDDSFEVEFTMEEDLMHGENALPSWIFDIEDDEDLELATSRHSSLLEELEIDIAQITFSVVWMLKSPFYFFLNGFSLAPSLANSRFSCLRNLSYTWARVTDYNSHPIKLGRRRVVSHLRSTSMSRLQGSMSPSSEVDIMSSSDVTAAPLALSSDFEESIMLPTTGSRNRSRTSSENMPLDGHGHMSGFDANSQPQEQSTGAGAGRGMLGDFFRGVWGSADGGNVLTPGKRKHSSPDLEGAGEGASHTPHASEDADVDNELAALLAHDPEHSRAHASTSDGVDEPFSANFGGAFGRGRGYMQGQGQGHGQGQGQGPYDTLNASASLQGFGVPSSGDDAEDKPFDFWGPFGVVTGYCSMLWLAGQDDVSYVYLVWMLSSTFHHFTVRPYLEESTILLHMSILGYSLVPLIPLVFLIVVSTLPSWSVTLIECLAVSWGSIAAVMSYKTILFPVLVNERGKDRARLLLLVPTVAIFQLYVIAFMPTRRWQINNGEALKIL